MKENTKEAIRQETKRYIDHDILYDDVYVGPFNEKDGIDCAVHAVEWYLDNIWHSTNEEPEEEKNILLVTKLDSGRLVYYLGLYDNLTKQVMLTVRTGFPWLKINKFKAWAYLDDLISDKMKLKIKED